MSGLFDINLFALSGQLLVGLINGYFYALLSLGQAIIFGLLKIINFAQGALYMVGAFAALFGLLHLSLSYWQALILVPLVVGVLGMLIQVYLIRRLPIRITSTVCC